MAGLFDGVGAGVAGPGDGVPARLRAFDFLEIREAEAWAAQEAQDRDQQEGE